MGSGEFVHAKWTLGIAAACVAALGLFSCSGGDVTGISTLSAAYDIIYEFDRRSGTCMDTCQDTDGDGICEGKACGDCDDCDDIDCCDDIHPVDGPNCTNGEDDDGDGFTDESDCTNNINDDGDADVDEANCDDGVDNDGDGSTDEREAVPTPCPDAGIDEIRLELAHFDGAVARFVLRADNFSADDVWRIRFGLTFNGDLFGYTYPSPGMEGHSLDYPGAVPWEKVPPPGGGSPRLAPKVGEGLANSECHGCCIEWTDYSCTGPGKKGDTCFQDIKLNDVRLCIKRSCTPSTPLMGDSCTAMADQVDCCECDDLNPLSRRCRRDVPPPGICCHNTCDQPLFTELEGNPDTDKQVNICCTAKAALQIEDEDCEAMAPCDDCPDECCNDLVASGGVNCVNGIDDDGDGFIDETDCTDGVDTDGDGQIDERDLTLAFSGTTPNGVVATIPLWVKAAREFDDFRFFFIPGESTVFGYDSDFPVAEFFTAGKGTVVAVD
jgi:hypothetical protein